LRVAQARQRFDKWYGWKAKSDNAWLESKDHSDALAAALRVSDGDNKAAELLVKWGERRADVLVAEQWPQIHKLAFALLERNQGKLNAQEIAKVLVQ